MLEKREREGFDVVRTKLSFNIVETSDLLGESALERADIVVELQSVRKSANVDLKRLPELRGHSESIDRMDRGWG